MKLSSADARQFSFFLKKQSDPSLFRPDLVSWLVESQIKYDLIYKDFLAESKSHKPGDGQGWVIDFIVNVYTDTKYKEALKARQGQFINDYVDLHYLKDQYKNDKDYKEYTKEFDVGELTYYAYYIFKGSKQGDMPKADFVSAKSFDWQYYQEQNKEVLNGREFRNQNDAYAHFIRFGIVQELKARTNNGFKIVDGLSSTVIVGADSPDTSSSPDPIIGSSSEPEASPAGGSDPTTSAGGSSGGGSDWAWDGTYSVETTGASDGWDTGNGWSATGVAALQRQALWYEPGTSLFGVESTQGNAF